MDDLERAPFGRALRVWIHRFPKGASRDWNWDWEIERGFHLEILGPSMFELNLRPRASRAGRSLAFLPDAVVSDLTRLLVWHKAPEDREWQEFANLLSHGKGYSAGLILSHLEQYTQTLRNHFRCRHYWRTTPYPVVELFQATPSAKRYFTVEKNLFSLGRVGRRLQRYAKIRRLLP